MEALAREPGADTEGFCLATAAAGVFAKGDPEMQFCIVTSIDPYDIGRISASFVRPMKSHERGAQSLTVRRRQLERTATRLREDVELHD